MKLRLYIPEYTSALPHIAMLFVYLHYGIIINTHLAQQQTDIE
ncbi:hypothetical protein HMPREF9075_02731 [Capnocytophaga sp. oral taxon 332 str. F0381]|nr:hypothetical protein HMPREF9075_02731 [Capnocytophaga sp. oral taxon 332 str. F0381]